MSDMQSVGSGISHFDYQSYQDLQVQQTTKTLDVPKQDTLTALLLPARSDRLTWKHTYPLQAKSSYRNHRKFNVNKFDTDGWSGNDENQC